MRPPGHRHIPEAFREIQQIPNGSPPRLHHVENHIPHPYPHRREHLIVPAAPQMNPLPRIPGQLPQPVLDRRMAVLIASGNREISRLMLIENPHQPPAKRLELPRGEQSRGFQHHRMSQRAHDIRRNKPEIENIVVAHGEFLHQRVQFIALIPQSAHRLISSYSLLRMTPEGPALEPPPIRRSTDSASARGAGGFAGLPNYPNYPSITRLPRTFQ